MRRLIALFLCLVSSGFALTCTLTGGTYATLASTSTNWTGAGCTGAYIPSSATDDRAILASTNLTIANGETWSIGSKTVSQVAVTGTGATFTVASGGTFKPTGAGNAAGDSGLTLFNFNAASTVTFATGSIVQPVCAAHCAGAPGSATINGTIQGDPTNYSWSTATSVTLTGAANSNSVAPSTYYSPLSPNLYHYRLRCGASSCSSTSGWLSNAAGTGLGSFGDTSLVFSAVSCNPACTGGNISLATEVASLDLVTGAGKYYVDYASSDVFWWQVSGAAATTTYTANYKYLVVTAGWYLTNPAGVKLYVDGAILKYGGPNGVGVGTGTLLFDTETSSANCTVTNSTFQYIWRPIFTKNTNTGCTITNNTFDLCPSDGSGYSNACIFIFNGSSTNVTISGNSGTTWQYFVNQYGAGGPFTGWSVTYNTCKCGDFMLGFTKTNTFPNMVIGNNFMFGLGASRDGRVTQVMSGTAGNPMVMSNNVILHALRACNYSDYNTVTGNVMQSMAHHGCSAGQDNPSATYLSPVYSNNVSNGLVSGGAWEFGYNTWQWTKLPTQIHNTSIGYNGLTWMDSIDLPSVALLTGMVSHSNMATNSTRGVFATNTAATGYTGLTGALDYQNVYGNTTQYLNWNQFGTVTGQTNVTGVSLVNPSATLPISGKTLALTYTSTTDITLTWDAGTPVQVYLSNSVATGATASTLTDTLQAWPVFTGAGAPIGAWLKITSGADVGDLVRVVNNTGTVLTVAPNFAITPGIGDAYTLYKGQVTLTATGGSTVLAGIDMRTLPTSTLSDTGVAITTHSTALNPQYVDSTRTVATWDAAMGGTGTESGAYARVVANPTVMQPSLLAYLRGGFCTQNPLLWKAGQDGADIGACDVPLVRRFSSSL